MSRLITRFAAGLAAAAAVLTLTALPASADASTDPAATKLTAQASSTRVDAGTPVTITGRLTSAAKPVAGVTVGIAYCTDDFCGEFDAQPVTDANGRYRATVTPVRSGHYRADFLPADETLAPADASTAGIVVIQPAEFTSFTATRAADGTITASGTLGFPRFTPPAIPVRIEYLTAGARCWTTAATVEAQWTGTAFGFSASAQLPGAGVWRAVYAGVPDQFHPAASQAVFVR
ncbi:hypothetical protein DMA12_31805 [Amycolatopsis balhimycina DSM 5908]|uniref:Carboxypeptidase regulatory-like domain-containing protein n=1 Tax=Amycolatopsis balhimycina DSM 5908 TaxID=1081091 RepID=A0A428W6X5_AMYBA|nr:hypothetical protein [Amycolatopsis balhimycina]RSM38856.1 hypothetical protein DMA12_31805 [Amycolatopsis balhimycina DSM 5908]